MTLAANELSRLVSMETGEIDRRIFTDEAIFDEEMRQIFGRAWLFLCHESQIPKAGDFFEAPMGRDNVLVVRQRDKSIRAMVNSCTHRGNAVCRAEEGNTKNFMCTYHGWTFDLGGDLVGVPGMERFYSNALDKKAHGLRRVAQLDTYKGFIFGTFDPEAPKLTEFLGATGRLSLDMIAERGENGVQIVPGIQKFVIDCNWKFTVDNLFDWYHPQITHMSAKAAGIFPDEAFQAFLDAAGPDSGGAKTPDGKDIKFDSVGDLSFEDSLVFLGEYGHAIAGPPVLPYRLDTVHAWRKRPGATEALGPQGMRSEGHPNVFPTMWITTLGQVSLRVPRTPTRTEIWWYSFEDPDAPQEEKDRLRFMNNHVFGPAGILEQEDGENWVQSTMHAAGDQSARIPQALKMNLGRGTIHHEDGLARIEGATNEHAQLWTYGAWAAWMSGCGWDELRERTTPGDSL